MFEKICKECGAAFQARYSREKYCCKECRMERNRKRAREEFRRKREMEKFEECQKRQAEREASRKEDRISMSLEEIARKSREAGLTYGQYVAKYRL